MTFSWTKRLSVESYSSIWSVSGNCSGSDAWKLSGSIMSSISNCCAAGEM